MYTNGRLFYLSGELKVIFRWAKKIFSTMFDVCLPAMLFAIGVFYYCDKSVSFVAEPDFFHLSFFVLFGIWGFYLFATHKTREGFLALSVLTVYIVLNNLKKTYGIVFWELSSYKFLGLFFLINWSLYCIADFFKFGKKVDFYLCCLLFAEGVVIENYIIPKESSYTLLFQLVILFCWIVYVLIYLSYISSTSNIKIYGEFFAFLSLSLGFFNSESPLAISLYGSLAVLILLVSTIYADVYCYFRDKLTGLYSLNTYLRHSKNFPLKYSLGVVCIDDYIKLLKVFGIRQTDLLVKMLVSKIKEASMGADIYRYNDDEFILIFKNEDKKQCFEYLETIRRNIAGSEFVLGSKQVVKLTISAGVSEKKRSDADVEPVLMRTREAVQRTYKFTQNMTSKA